jgi:hypothetical protein
MDYAARVIDEQVAVVKRRTRLRVQNAAHRHIPCIARRPIGLSGSTRRRATVLQVSGATFRQPLLLRSTFGFPDFVS